MKLEYACGGFDIEDYQACKRFYCDILGFEVFFANDNNQYAELVKGEFLITIYNCQKFKDWICTTESVDYDGNNSGIALKFTVNSTY